MYAREDNCTQIYFAVKNNFVVSLVWNLAGFGDDLWCIRHATGSPFKALHHHLASGLDILC